MATVERGGERVCENCAREDDDLEPVHRVYVVPESWDTPGSATVVDDVEIWCFSCRSQYPHEQADDTDQVDESE